LTFGLSHFDILTGAIKNPFSSVEKRCGQEFRSLLIFSETLVPAGIGTWALKLRASTGCRGVTGPVPQPLAMSSLVSTNADILISTLKVSNDFSVLPWSIANTSRIPRIFSLAKRRKTATFVVLR
jgi:hypothetical protein